MAAAIILALQLLFGSQAAATPTSAQIQQASLSCQHSTNGIIVSTDQQEVN